MARVAIIGAGNMGRAHAAAWASLGEEVAFVCAPRAAEPRERPEPLPGAETARIVHDLDDVLEDPAVDILSVCTPTDSHADIAVRALAAGRNVLLEKPIALELDDALAIRDAAAASSGMLMVAHVVRFFAGYERVRDAVDDGRVGRPWTVRAERLTSGGAAPAWLSNEARSGGILVDFAIHDFDQLNLLLGEPVAVTSLGSTSAAVETSVEYEGGGIGRVLTSMALPTGFPFSTSLDVVGSHGSARYASSGAAPGAPGLSEYRETSAHGETRARVTGEDPYTRQAEYFLHCLVSETPPSRSPIDGAIAALRVSRAARQSLSTGQRVPLEPLDLPPK